MNNIVIVEDKLLRGISLAEQFIELANERKELGIKILSLCYFNKDKEQATKDIKECGEQSFEVKHVSAWDFDEVMDGYMRSYKNNIMIIFDYMLDGDGSAGVPMRRINIRYARREERYKSNQLWFYTGTGVENNNLLCELVGEEHVLEVREAQIDRLVLNLENERFMEALKKNASAEE